MNLGKDNGNQSLSGFDDMTFDDMTFDDEPLQDGFQQNNFNNTNINNNQFMQPSMNNTGGVGNMNGAVNIGNQQPIQQQPQMQNFNGQSQMQMQQPMQMDMQDVGGKGKKAKKQKPPKAPKPPKQKKVKQQTQQDANQAYAMALGNHTVNPEDIEKKPLNLKIIIPAAVVAVAAIAGIVILNMPKNTDKHVTLANNTPAIETPSDDKDVAGGIVVGENITDKEDEKEETPGMTVLKLNEPMKIGIVVNTKIEGDTEYTDHQTYLKVEYSNFVSGYDNVKTYLDEYNETATNKINLPSKDEFYASSVGNDLVMYEVTVTVPEDFPTNDKKHGYTGLNPEFKLEIKGTEKEDALITQLYEFAIPSVYFIGSDTSSFTIGNAYTLRYMTTMPMDLKTDGYELFFSYINDGTVQKYGLTGLDIPKNNDVVEVSNEIVEDTETTEGVESDVEVDGDKNIADNALDAITDTDGDTSGTSEEVENTETEGTEQETE